MILWDYLNYDKKRKYIMKIIRVEIAGFGKYRDFQFDFTTGNQLLYGENEAGKSTLYHFILAMLFGFPKKSKRKRDYTPKNHGQYGGKLVIEHRQKTFCIERYKSVNRGKAQILSEGQYYTEAEFYQFISPLNEALFRQVFTFDQEQLTDLAHLEANALQSALISLGITGSQQLFQQVEAYEKENQKIYADRAQKLPINQKLVAYDQLNQEISLAEQKQAALAKEYQQLKQYKAKQATLASEHQALLDTKQNYQQQQLHFALYEEYQALQKQPLSMVDPHDLQDLQHFYQEYSQLQEQIQQHEAKLSQLEQSQRSQRYLFFLEQEATIHQLLKNEPLVYQAASELQRLEQMLESTQQSLAKCSMPTEDLATIDADDLRQLRQKEQEYSLLNEKKEYLYQQQVKAEATLNQFEAAHPEIFQSTPPKTPLLLVVGALILGVLSFACLVFQPKWAWLFFLATVGDIAYWYYKVKKVQPTDLKPLWQRYLQTLDEASDQYQQIIVQLESCQQETKRLRQLLPASWQEKTVEEITDLLQTTNLQQQQKTQLVAQQTQLQAELKKQRTLLEQWQQACRPYYEWLAIAHLPIVEQYQQIREFYEQMQAEKLQRSKQPVTQIAEALNFTRQEVQRLFNQQKPLLQKYQIEQINDLPLWFRQQATNQQMAQRLLELKPIVTPLFKQPITKTQLEEQVAIINQQLADNQEATTNQVKAIAQIELAIKQQSSDNHLLTLYQKQSQLKAEIVQLLAQWSINYLVSQQLQNFASQLSTDQFPQLLRLASEYLAILSNQVHSKLHLRDDELLVDEQSLYQLSTGTKDQLIMALRFAYLALQLPNILCPIIIDDGWLHYDSKRKQALAQLLQLFGKDYQVICLSSDKEMVSYYQELNQSVHRL